MTLQNSNSSVYVWNRLISPWAYRASIQRCWQEREMKQSFGNNIPGMAVVSFSDSWYTGDGLAFLLR